MPTVSRGHVPGRSAITWVGADPGPRQADLPAGAFLRTVLWLLGVPLLLIGPFLMYAAAFLAADEPTVNRWGMVAGGLAVTVACVKLAGSELRLHKRARRDLHRLESVGVAAVAEVTAVRPASLGEENGVELSLVISGPGFAPFESTSRCKEHPALSVGARLNAVVDPTDRLYAIVP